MTWINKCRKLPSEVKASYWYAICNLFQKGLAFIVIPIYTRLLTTSEYGAYSVYISWYNIILIFASLSLSSGFFNVGILKYESDKNGFVSCIQGLSTLSTIIIIIICSVFYNTFCKMTGFDMLTFLVMSLQLIFATPMLYWSAKERFDYKYRAVVITTVILSVATVVLSLCFIHFFTDKKYALIIGNAIIQIVFGAYFFVHNWVCGKRFFDKELWKYACSFGIVLIPHYLAYSILNAADRVMIDNICGTSYAGIYSLACNISIAINIITVAIDGSLNPWVFRKLKNKDLNSIAKMTDAIVIGFGVVVILCCLVSPELLQIVSSPEYDEAKWVMPPVIIGCFFLYLAGCFMRVTFYHEKKNKITIASITAAVINILLNYLLIPRCGYIAAAYTTLMSYAIFSVIHYVLMVRICRNNKYEKIPFHSQILLILSIMVTIIGLGLLVVYNMPIVRYGLFGIVCIVVLINRKKVINVLHEIKKEKGV